MDSAVRPNSKSERTPPFSRAGKGRVETAPQWCEPDGQAKVAAAVASSEI